MADNSNNKENINTIQFPKLSITQNGQSQEINPLTKPGFFYYWLLSQLNDELRQIIPFASIRPLVTKINYQQFNNQTKLDLYNTISPFAEKPLPEEVSLFIIKVLVAADTKDYHLASCKLLMDIFNKADIFTEDNSVKTQLMKQVHNSYTSHLNPDHFTAQPALFKQYQQCLTDIQDCEKLRAKLLSTEPISTDATEQLTIKIKELFKTLLTIYLTLFKKDSHTYFQQQQDYFNKINNSYQHILTNNQTTVSNHNISTTNGDIQTTVRNVGLGSNTSENNGSNNTDVPTTTIDAEPQLLQSTPLETSEITSNTRYTNEKYFSQISFTNTTNKTTINTKFMPNTKTNSCNNCYSTTFPTTQQFTHFPTKQSNFHSTQFTN